MLARTQPLSWWAYLWPALGVSSMVSYNTWLLWWPLNGRSAVFNGYLSELSASDQPNNLFFRGGDLVTGLLVLTVAIRAVQLSRRHGRHPSPWLLVAAVGLVVFGLSSIGDAVLAMDCSPTLSSSCRGLEGSGQLSTGHYLHTGTSVAAQAGIITSLAAARWAVRESAATAPRRLALLSVICAVEAVALIVMLGMIVAGMPGFGYPQVVMVVAASVWFAAVGFWLLGWSSVCVAAAAASKDTSVDRVEGHIC